MQCKSFDSSASDVFILRYTTYKPIQNIHDLKFGVEMVANFVPVSQKHRDYKKNAPNTSHNPHKCFWGLLYSMLGLITISSLSDYSFRLQKKRESPPIPTLTQSTWIYPKRFPIPIGDVTLLLLLTAQQGIPDYNDKTTVKV